ncbi:agamous-like MADS-box protein AGL82 [Vigna unguiculata]|nr:agamous-like MADS-box protein AGL82 [Vigna unguiculata]
MVGSFQDQKSKNMGRPKLILKPITNKKDRDLALMKRKKALMKTISEFCSVCGVKACLIIYDGKGDSPPLTWPQDPIEMHSIIQRYERIMFEKIPKNFDLNNFFEIRKNTVDTEISKVQREILDIKYPTWHPCFNNLGAEELKNFIAGLDTKLEACNQRTMMFKCKKQNEAQFINFKQCLIQPDCVAPNPIQPSFMQDIFQNQLLLAPMNTLNCNLAPSFQFNLEKGSSSQSLKLNFDPNLMRLKAENRGMVDTANACQIDGLENPSNKFDVPSDLLDESMNLFDQFGEIQSLNQHWGNIQHDAHMIGGSITTMNGNQCNPESSLCNYNGVMQFYNYDASLQNIGFQ